MATGVLPQREIIKFEAGRPEVVCLKYATGKTVKGLYGDQVMYTTVDDRIFYVDFDVAELIDRCGVPQGEPIQITKHRGAKNAVYWDVRAAARESASPMAPARPVSNSTTASAPPSVLESQLRASIEHAEARKAAAPEMLQASNWAGALESTTMITPAQAKLLAALCVAIDSCVEAQAYAQRRGLPLAFTGEDVRCFANTILINAERGAR